MIITHSKLNEIVQEILIEAGADTDNARIVSNLLVKSNLAGHDSHGVLRVNQYVNQINSGLIKPSNKPSVELDGVSYLKIDGNRTFGQVAASYTVEHMLRKLETCEVVIGSCINMSHIGRLGDYVSMLSEKGYLAYAMCNGGGPNVAAFGSKERLLGTNPIAAGVPLENEEDIQIDFASAATAEGKLNVARNKSESISQSLLLDKNGEETINPNDFYDGGVILPIGWHKGSALSIMLEIFAGIFTGGRCSVFDDYVDGNGLFIFASKPDLFRDKKDFENDIYLLKKKIKSSKKDINTSEVLFPGEKESRSIVKLVKDGIKLDNKTIEILEDLSKKFGLKFEN